VRPGGAVHFPARSGKRHYRSALHDAGAQLNGPCRFRQDFSISPAGETWQPWPMSLRIILVTGGNSGLGQAIGRAFLQESSENYVWLGIHSRREAADQLTSQHPEQSACLPMDVTSPEAWQAAVAAILAGHHRLDVLVNNAGGHEDALLGTMPAASWHSVLARNLDGVFHGCQAVLPTMISQRAGRIVNMASLSALLAPAGQTNYAAAKAGVVALTQSLAKEVARLGITVNAICPGFVETEALARLEGPERAAAQARVPMRRFGRPEEVAAAVRFLASAEASYITGSILKVDGGIL
jgi:3-oxoacyl-[acyl-carrier protein] reductase